MPAWTAKSTNCRSRKTAPTLKKTFAHNIEAIVDRIVLKPEIRSRLADSVETALRLSQGLVIVSVCEPGQYMDDTVYSAKNSPARSIRKSRCRNWSRGCFRSTRRMGRARPATGWGRRRIRSGDDRPRRKLSLENGAIEAWRKNGKRMNIYYSRALRQFCRDFGSLLRAVQGHPQEGPADPDVRHRRQGRHGDRHLIRRRHPQSATAIRKHRKRIRQSTACINT